MNRHPAVLARMVATVADLAPGRVELGIGIGGHPAEHTAYGIDFPAPPERAARLDEAVEVIRALFTGGPVSFQGAWYRLDEAYASPAPVPAPRIIVGGETPAGARLAARVGDGWTCMESQYDAPAAGVRRGAGGGGPVTLGRRGHRGLRPAPRGTPRPHLARDGRPRERGPSAWRERGADELVLHWVKADQVEAVLAAGERAWG